MPNSKAKNVARKHRKAKARWSAKRQESMKLAKVKPEPKKKISVFERAKAMQDNSPLSGASPSAVSNPTGGIRTAPMMTFDQLKATNG